jgi:hypothetical protein
MSKHLIFTVLIISAASLESTFAQCDNPLKHSVSIGASGHYVIYLEPLDESITVDRIVLQDLITGQKSNEITTSMIVSKKTEIFREIRPSRYTIYVWLPSCKRPVTLGGKDGIKVGID